MRRFVGCVSFLVGAIGLASLLSMPMDLPAVLLFIASAATMLVGALVFMFDREV